MMNRFSRLLAAALAVWVAVPLGAMGASLPPGISAGDNRVPSYSSAAETVTTGPDGAIVPWIANMPALDTAPEHVQLQASVPGAGALVYCKSDASTTSAVSCVYAAQGEGGHLFGGADGIYHAILAPNGVIIGYMTETPAIQNGSYYLVTYQPQSGKAGPTGAGAYNPTVGVYYDVGSGIALGHANKSLNGAISAGYNNTCIGTYSLCTGASGYDFSAAGLRAHMSALASGQAIGGNQINEQTTQVTITGSSSSAVTGRMTVDGTAAATNTRSAPIQANGHGTFGLAVECSNLTTGDQITWQNVTGGFTRIANLNRVNNLTGTTGTSTSAAGAVGAGTVSGMTLAVSYDATNANLNASVTLPSGATTANVSCSNHLLWMQKIS